MHVHIFVLRHILYNESDWDVGRIRCSWNRLDIAIVILSIIGIILEEIKSGLIPINPTIIRAMRVLRIARGRFVSLNWLGFSFTSHINCVSDF